MLLKILVVAAAIALAWYGLRYLQRAGAAPRRVRRSARQAVAELRPCPACGTFVEPGAPRCEQHDCPLPRG